MISFRPLIGAGPKYFLLKESTAKFIESRGAFSSVLERSSSISAQGCVRFPLMLKAMLQETGQCPFLNTRPADARTFSGTAGFTELRRIVANKLKGCWALS